VAIRGADFTYPALTEEAAEAGWYITPNNSTCRYFREDGEPACIIGTALSLLGYGPEDVTEGDGSLDLLTKLGAPYFLGVAALSPQTVQDHGGTWGEALEAYYKRLKEETGAFEGIDL